MKKYEYIIYETFFIIIIIYITLLHMNLYEITFNLYSKYQTYNKFIYLFNYIDIDIYILL